jgi:hypothetical protein
MDIFCDLSHDASMGDPSENDKPALSPDQAKGAPHFLHRRAGF